MLPATSVTKIISEIDLQIFFFFFFFFFFQKCIVDMHNVFVYVAPLQLGAK